MTWNELSQRCLTTMHSTVFDENQTHRRISKSPSNQLLNAADDLGLFRSHSTQETMRADIRPHKGFSDQLSCPSLLSPN